MEEINIHFVFTRFSDEFSLVEWIFAVCSNFRYLTSYTPGRSERISYRFVKQTPISHIICFNKIQLFKPSANFNLDQDALELSPLERLLEWDNSVLLLLLRSSLEGLYSYYSENISMGLQTTMSSPTARWIPRQAIPYPMTR